MKKIKIVLADGNDAFVDALKLVSEEPEIALLSGASSGVDALRNANLQPDVAVIGEVLPDLTIVEAAKEIRRSVRGIRFFIYDQGQELICSLC